MAAGGPPDGTNDGSSPSCDSDCQVGIRDTEVSHRTSNWNSSSRTGPWSSMSMSMSMSIRSASCAEDIADAMARAIFFEGGEARGSGKSDVM